MDKYICKVCATIYDPEIGDIEDGIKPQTPFEAIPDDWTCPICGSPKSSYELLSAEMFEIIKKKIRNNLQG